MMWKLSDFSDSIAAVDEDGKEYSYSFLASKGKELAGKIGGRALVFSMCTNTIGSLLGYTAMINHKIVPLMLSATLDKGLLLQLIATYKPDYIWLPNSTENKLEFGETVYENAGYTLIKTEYDHVYPLYEDLALLLTTSGSTGSPKLVRQSYKNIEANMNSIIEYLEIDASDVSITSLPMNYTYGLSIVNTYMKVGAKLVLTDKSLMEKEFWQMFKEFEVTSFSGVPYIYEMLDKLRFVRMDLPSLRTMTQAGGKLSPVLHEKFAKYALEKGKRFVVMYGQTEATARMAYLPYKMSLEKCGSTGIAIPGGRFSLIDVEGNEILESNVCGELVYEGPNVTLGYAEQGSELSKGDERNGKLITGDMAKRDEDGFYYIVGRKKRFLKLFGSRVNLDETERLIKAAYPEYDCVCAGVDDKLYVFITDSSAESTILSYLAEKTGFHHSAFRAVVVDEIPRNESGKIIYSEFEKYYN